MQHRQHDHRSLLSLVSLLVCLGVQSSALAETAASTCPANGKVLSPKGQRGDDIESAIRRAGDGGTVLLTGEYLVDSTIRLRDGTTLCSTNGATLLWTDPDEHGMMLSAVRASDTTIKNLILDGRGIVIKGSGHTIERNLIRNIASNSSSEKRWSERHGILVADNGENITIRNNLFSNIVDTGIIGYKLNKTVISGNQFQNVLEGIHLWTAENTTVDHNSGTGFKAMAFEIQGENRPGLVVEYNACKGWPSAFQKGAYAMSVVAGKNAIIRHNTIEGTPRMVAGLEIGGLGPQVSANTLIDVDLVVTDAPDTVLEGNLITRAGIHKDINRAKFGKLTIKGNVITDAPMAAIVTDNWSGFDQVIITGNRISKTIDSPAVNFIGILAVDSDKQPIIITDNQIVIRSPAGIKPTRAACIGNSGYQGNLKGMIVDRNTCDGGGVSVFSDSNSWGGHIGVQYRGNKLLNLIDTIKGDSQGLSATGNEFTNVQNDQAKLKGR
jgi:Right handed beta helix region